MGERVSGLHRAGTCTSCPGDPVDTPVRGTEELTPDGNRTAIGLSHSLNFQTMLPFRQRR